MSLDSILRATGKNLANCGEKADWYSPISDLTNLTVSDGVVSLPAVSYGSGMAINKNRVFTNGETFTIHANHTSPTGDVPANQYRYILKPYKNNTVVKDITITGWAYNQYYNAYYSSGTSKSFTLPKDTVNSFEWGFGFLAYGDISAGTVLTYSNIQIEKGSTATTYEPYEYLGPKTIKMSSNSKNLIPYPYDTTSLTISGITFTFQEDGGIKVTGTATASSVLTIKSIQVSETGKQYTFSGYTSGSGVSLVIRNSGSVVQAISLNTQNQTKTFTANYSDYVIAISVPKNTTVDALFYPQLEEGSVATDYELNTGSKEVLKVSYNSRNLLPYPWTTTTKTKHGITFTDNGDGSLTISGTATAETYFILQRGRDYGNQPINAIATESATNGKYAVSKRLYYNNNSKVISVNILNGATINETIYPQIELGDKATDYVPYFNTVVWTYKQPVLTGYNITSTTNADGTQSLNITNATSTTDHYNITSTDNSDGTQTLNITDA